MTQQDENEEFLKKGFQREELPDDEELVSGRSISIAGRDVSVRTLLLVAVLILGVLTSVLFLFFALSGGEKQSPAKSQILSTTSTSPVARPTTATPTTIPTATPPEISTPPETTLTTEPQFDIIEPLELPDGFRPSGNLIEPDLPELVPFEAPAS